MGYAANTLDGRQLGDEPRLSQAAADRDVGLDDVESAQRKQLARLTPRLDQLATREVDLQGSGEPRVLGIARLGQGLLEPAKTQAAELSADLERLRKRVGGVGVCHHLEVGPFGAQAGDGR